MTAIHFAQSSGWWGGMSTHELLLAFTWVAMGIATVVLLVMSATGRGNARRVRISLMLSIIAHCTVVLCTDRIPIVSPQSRADTPEPTFEIEQLVFTALDEEQNVANRDARPWEDLADMPLPTPDAPTYEEVIQDLHDTEREDREVDDTETEVLADVPDISDEPIQIPRAENNAPETPRTADGTQLDNYEETATARPEVEVPTTRAGEERQPEDQGLAESNIERDSRRGQTDDPTTDLRESRRMEVADATTDPTAQLQRGPNSEAAVERTADAAETLPASDPGTRTAERREEVGRGLPRSRAAARRDLTGSTPPSDLLKDDVERRRRPETEIREPDSRFAVREGTTQPVTDDAQLKLTRNNTPRTGDNRVVARLPATYQLRNVDVRERVAIRHGATTASEEAVENSLKWLAAHQSVEGNWDADGFMANCPEGVEACWGPGGQKPHQGSDREDVPKSGVEGDAGLTGLAVLAFLGAGYTHEEGVYADQVDRALRWLIRQQQEDGFLGGKATHYARMYCHGMAAIALGEAYGMTQDPTLREPLQKAIDYIVARQNPRDGGWRYTVGKLGDMSMFGWQLMALKSAETAGLQFPPNTRKLTIEFLVSHSRGPSKGLAAYRNDEEVTPAMTAEALFCKQVLGIKRDNVQSTTAVTYLMQHLPKQSEQNLYYWYYGTLAMFQYGGQPWDRWNERVRDTLVETQRKDGHAAGSWDPRPPWGEYGGRVYSTVLSTLCLEVYYRFLPMYRAGESD